MESIWSHWKIGFPPTCQELLNCLLAKVAVQQISLKYKVSLDLLEHVSAPPVSQNVPLPSCEQVSPSPPACQACKTKLHEIANTLLLGIC